eukprot:6461011-Prymnesium_polylepis.1
MQVPGYMYMWFAERRRTSLSRTWRSSRRGVRLHHACVPHRSIPCRKGTLRTHRATERTRVDVAFGERLATQ